MLTLPSFAKINLSLELIGRRPDGYVEIRTIFQSIDLRDTLDLEEAPAGILEVECDDPSIPAGSDNLVWKAASLLRERTGVRKGARISLSKRIPAGAGLGGGSGNAAVALLGLDALWGTRLDPFDRHLLASRLGSDVPYFLYGGTALGLGRGEEIYPLPDVPPIGVLVVKPPFPLSTAVVYERARRRLTPRQTGHTIWRFSPQGLAAKTGYSFVINELEPAAAEEQPLLPSLRGRLVDLGAAAAALCGSGSAVFGLFGAGDGSRSGDVGIAGGFPDGIVTELSREFGGSSFHWCRTLGAGAYRDEIYGRL